MRMERVSPSRFFGKKTPIDDRGQAVVVKPWDTLSDEERLDQLRSLNTARWFPYQRLEMRSGGPVCVENRQ